MITKNQITEVGFALVKKGRELNKNHVVGERYPLKDFLPDDISNSFQAKTEGIFVTFSKEGKGVNTCVYDFLKEEYITRPNTYSYIGMFFRDGVRMDADDAYRIGDVVLNGIERDEPQKEREFTWKESHDYEMEM